jgi:hypothetical protein
MEVLFKLAMRCEVFRDEVGTESLGRKEDLLHGMVQELNDGSRDYSGVGTGKIGKSVYSNKRLCM